jgi:proteasome accessory factor C
MAKPLGNSARDKLNLFLAIVPFVLLRGSVTVDEVAKQFATTREKVISAVKTIACDGGANEARFNFETELFNIDWEAFEDDGVIILTVAELLHVPTPFNARQRSIFLAGLELLKAHPHYRRLPEFDDLISTLRGSETNAATDAFAVAVDTDNPTAHTIQDAIDKQVRIGFGYVNNKGERSVREVDPYRQHIKGGQRYVKGHCYQAGEVRTFNLDSMDSLEVSATPIEERTVDPLALTSELFSESDNDVHVELVIDPQALSLIAGYRRPGYSPLITDDSARLTIPFSHFSTAVRMVSALSGIAAIVEPAEVRADVAAFARRALDAYAQTN